MTHPRALQNLLMALLPAAALAAEPDPPADLDAVVATTGRQLETVWRGDPLTAPQPVPQAAVERQQLQDSFDIYGTGGVAFWLALGMAQAVPLPRPPSPAEELPPAATSLQRICLAGTLLGAMPARGSADHEQTLQQAVKTARVAYAPSLAPQVGSPGQRAYALLTGSGGTGLTCSGPHMRQLAAGDVPDPELIERLTANRDPSVGIAIFCRQPPACPRRLGASTGVGAI